jgi:peptidoglycan/LPS O-acetylase OafA/YrhL
MSRRIPSLDGLRAVSILLVIAGHLSERLGGAVAATSYLLSKLGVHTFFVISGFLITTLLQDEYASSGRIDLRQFYRRRCFRIFPAALAYILIIAALVPETHSSVIYALTYSVSYVTTNVHWLFMHLWSLSVEEQFYLLWPLALVFSFRRRAAVAWISMLLAAVVRYWLWRDPTPANIALAHSSFPAVMDSIAAGCLLAVYRHRLQSLQWMWQTPTVMLATVATTWILATLLWDGEASVLWGVVPLTIALTIFLLVERADWLLNNRLACAIGILSYSLYLWQEPFAMQGRPALSVPALAGCAIGSYFLVEQPMLKLGRRLTSSAHPGGEVGQA